MQCGKPYSAENIHLRGAFKNMYLFQLACEDHAAFATITVIGQNDQKIDVRLSIDDCIAFHHELRAFSGDFSTVFNESVQ